MPEEQEDYREDENDAPDALINMDIFSVIPPEEVDELLAEFVPLYEFADHLDGIKMEVESKQKDGKTYLAMSACELIPENPNLSDELRLAMKNGVYPKGSPVYVFDTEGKAKKMYRNWGFGKKDPREVKIFRVLIPNKEDMLKTDPIKSLIKLVMIIKALGTLNHGTLVIDSWSDISKWVRKYIQYNIKQAKLIEKGELGDNDFDLIRLATLDYEIRGDIIGYILLLLQNHHLNVILTTRLKEKWGKKKGDEKGVGPSGKFKPHHYYETPYFMDLEMRLVKQDDGRTITRHGMIVTNEFEEDVVDKEFVKFQSPTFPAIVDRLFPILTQRPEDRKKRKQAVEKARKEVSKKIAKRTSKKASKKASKKRTKKTGE